MYDHSDPAEPSNSLPYDAAVEISANVFWQDPFRAIATKQHLTEFIILDITPAGPPRGKVSHALDRAWCCKSN